MKVVFETSLPLLPKCEVNMSVVLLGFVFLIFNAKERQNLTPLKWL